MRMEPKSPSKHKFSINAFTQYKGVLKVCIFILVVVLFFVGCYFVFKPSGDILSRSYYTVVVDCGSTGTRVNVYEWKINYVESEHLPILMHSYPDNSTKGSTGRSSCQYHCLQTEPGLDKFVGNASGVRASLESLILWAERLVPLERHGDTPIFVLATAGLRMLADEDARLVLDDVEAVLKEHSFLYKKSWIKVLSGKEEAYYGWVALNYKLGTLTNSSRTSTSGLLDLGGSSLQVVMEHNVIGDNKHLIRSEIGLIEHRILAYSLPAFGLNEAFDRTVAILSQLKTPKEAASDRVEIRHPCIKSDFVQNYTCYACAQQNISDQEILSGQIQRTKSASIYLVGDPNWEQCRGLARVVAINSTKSEWSHLIIGKNCKAGLSSSSSRNILNVTSIARPTGHFHALSGFFVVYNKLNLSSRANLTKVWEKGEQLCSRSWTDLSYNAKNQNYVAQHCFQVTYMASLIEEALCLGEAEIIFGPGDLSWTLGAALIEGRYLWRSIIKAQTSFSILKHAEVFSSPIYLFLFLLILLSVVYCSQIKIPMPGKKASNVGVSLPSYIHPKRRPN